MRRILLLLLPLSVALAAEPAPPPLEPIPANQLPTTFDLAQYAFDVRIEQVSDGSNEARFRTIEKICRGTSKPHLQAYYARFLYGGKGWGAPEGRKQEAVRLALEALKRGSVRAYTTLGSALIDGKVVAPDYPRAFDYFRRGANAGDPQAMGELGTQVRDRMPAQADYWYNRAAFFGQTNGLLWMAQAYEQGEITGKPDLNKACRYYLQAGLRRSIDARECLKKLAEKGDPTGELYHSRLLLELTARGFENRRVVMEAAARYVEAHCGNDPEALVELGDAYGSGAATQSFDPAKARQFYGRAVKLGSLDARVRLARYQIDGYGVKKDKAAGLAELKRLAALNNGEALGYLGYYFYWGDHDAGEPRNPTLAAFYSTQSAAANDGIGAHNLALLYSDGIGVKKDYALAAVYMYAAYHNGGIGSVSGSRLTNDFLAFVKD